MKVPLLDLKPQYNNLKSEIIKKVEEICDSQYFILGPEVEKFEAEIAEYCGTKYACGVSSGSDALIIALMVEGIGAGDEVITTPFTFFATAGAIARVGATPVFVDIDPKTFNIDPSQILEKVTSKTKAIIPVQLFGQSCDMDAINDIAKDNNLIIIEDAAQSIGSEYKGKRIGSLGDYGCFSFFPSKNLGAFGDGGIVTTNDKEKYELLKIFRNHGSEPKYFHKYIGGNFRLDALQAAILSIKLKSLDTATEKRQANAEEYRSLFKDSKLTENEVILPQMANYDVRHIYNQFSILVKNGKRDELKQTLIDSDIGCDVYYPVPLHLQECFKALGYKKGDCPISERVADEIIAIPIFPETNYEQREFVVSVIENFLV